VNRQSWFCPFLSMCEPTQPPPLVLDRARFRGCEQAARVDWMGVGREFSGARSLVSGEAAQADGQTDGEFSDARSLASGEAAQTDGGVAQRGDGGVGREAQEARAAAACAAVSARLAHAIQVALRHMKKPKP
jgi:hypothetical protein